MQGVFAVHASRPGQRSILGTEFAPERMSRPELAGIDIIWR